MLSHSPKWFSYSVAELGFEPSSLPGSSKVCSCFFIGMFYVLASAISCGKDSRHTWNCSTQSTFAYNSSGCQSVHIKLKFFLRPCRSVPGTLLAPGQQTWKKRRLRGWEAWDPNPSSAPGSLRVCPKLRNWPFHQTHFSSADFIIFNCPSLSLLSSHGLPCSSLNTGGSPLRTFALAGLSAWKCFFLR